MSGCCTSDGYRQMFSERGAQFQARRYRKRGPDAMSRRLVELIGDRAAGASVLEVGGGIGTIQLELLQAGAAGATSVELTPSYESEAKALASEKGLAGRTSRRILDFADQGAEVEPADVVVLNRVLCCYHDMPRLAAQAAAHTRRVLVLSFPKQRLWTRLVVAAVNFGLWATRRQFHMFLHAPARIRAVALEQGLRAVYDRPGLFWEVAMFEREQPLGSAG